MPIIGQNMHRALQREHLGARGKFLTQTTHAKEVFPEMLFELHMEIWLGDMCTWREETGYFRNCKQQCIETCSFTIDPRDILQFYFCCPLILPYSVTTGQSFFSYKNESHSTSSASTQGFFCCTGYPFSHSSLQSFPLFFILFCT